MRLKRSYTWIPISLLLLLVACGGGPGKPSVKLSASPTILEDGQEITLSATVTGGQGSSKVEFFKGTEKVGEDPSAPYELKLALTASDDANFLFTAKATAADKQFGVSDGVNVSVKTDKTPPAVVLKASSSTLNAAGPVTLTATAADNKEVVKVEFFKGANKLGEDTTSADGFSLVVNLAEGNNGSAKYSAKAYDAKGNVGTSAEVGVTVDIDVTNPTVSLSANKTTVTLASSATLTANASDDKGVAKVEFYEGINKLGEDTQAPFTFTINYTASANGSHTYTAKAFDAKGNSAISGEVTITVEIDGTLPAVSLATDKPTITVAESATLTATASDDKGIVKVEFYKGTDKIAEDTESPFVHPISFTDAGNGTHTYSAKATDTSGNIATSDPITITVDIDVIYPKVSLSSNPASLDAAGSITLTANASDNKAVTKVEFYKGATLLGTDTDGSDGFKQVVEYNTEYIHTDTFSAKVFDGAGNATVSDPVKVNILVDTTPPVVFLSPSSTAVAAAGSITLSATFIDASGIAKVEFYMVPSTGEPTLLAIDSDGSDGYQHTISFVNALDNTTYSYTAKAFDKSNNSATSVSKSVSVNIPFSFASYPAAGNPQGMTFDSSGNLWYVQRGGSKISKIAAADLVGCTDASCPSTDYPVAGSPADIAFDSSGNLWFAQNTGNKISKIVASDLADPAICSSASCPRTDYPAAGNPVGMTFDSSGNLWFAQNTGNKISKIAASDLADPAICSSASCPRTDYPAAGNPGDVTFDSNGNLWFTQYGSHQISKIVASDLADPAICSSASCPRTDYPAAGAPVYLTFDSSGALWFGQYNSTNISRIKAADLAACTVTSCTRTDFAITSNPGGLAFDSTGTLWFTLRITNKIARVP